MPNAKQSAAEKIKRNLFRPKDEITEKFSASEYERKKRIMLAVTKLLDDPIAPDKELVDFLTTGCGGVCKSVESSTAYRDLLLIRSITGNIKLASKDWERYMVVETAKAEIRKVSGKDSKAVASLLKVINEARDLKTPDIENYHDQMIPFEPEVTHDPVVLGDDIEIIDNVDERRKELRHLFRKDKIQDAQIVEDSEETV